MRSIIERLSYRSSDTITFFALNFHPDTSAAYNRMYATGEGIGRDTRDMKM